MLDVGGIDSQELGLEHDLRRRRRLPGRHGLRFRNGRIGITLRLGPEPLEGVPPEGRQPAGGQPPEGNDPRGIVGLEAGDAGDGEDLLLLAEVADHVEARGGRLHHFVRLHQLPLGRVLYPRTDLQKLNWF